MRYETKNLNELPKFRDGLSYLYVEYAVIEQEAQAIALYQEEGVVMVPAAALGTLLLGPGTRITHAAIKALAANGCSVQWTGQDMVRFYASGTGETRSSARLQKQAEAWADEAMHLEVVKRLYRYRFPEPLEEGLTLEQIRGREGVRVRDTYAFWSRQTGVRWKGRNYKRGNWDNADPINRAISSGTAALYGLSHAAIVSAGYSAALGFIHTGKQLSFVYDVADLYKAELVIPAAFCAVQSSTDDIERRMRYTLRQRCKDIKLLERIVDDLHRLFTNLSDAELATAEAFNTDAAKPGDLWDDSGNVKGGVSYGLDGTGKRSKKSEG